jgi:hypothetical protein
MRHTSRLGASLRYAFLPVGVLIFSFVLGRTAYGQAPSASSAQSEQRVTSPALPAAWNDGVKALTEKIVRAVTPSRAISLEINNVSSLGTADLEAIRKALETELQTEGLRILPSEADVEVTLSENSAGYIWVAETRRDSKQRNSSRVAIISVSRGAVVLTGGNTESLALSKRLVWQQPTEFLDFLIAERPTTVMSSSLIILEPDRLVYYRSTTPQWQLQQAIPFPHTGQGNRNFQGRISTSFQKVWGPGGECSGDLGDPTTVKCSPKITILAGARVGVKIPGYEAYQSELLSERCGDKSIALVSGNGDWTQPDSLQGYLFTDVVNPNAIASGGPIEFDGPIMAMQTDDRESVRVIVRNLKTGNYEGYVVTATCNH